MAPREKRISLEPSLKRFSLMVNLFIFCTVLLQSVNEEIRTKMERSVQKITIKLKFIDYYQVCA